MSPLRGIFAAMCTPFDETGEHIVEAAYLAHIDRMIDAGLQQLIQIGGGVMSGVDPLAPWALMAGATGMIWGAANFMPRQCAALYNLIAAGQHAAALALWDEMKAIALWLWENDQGVDYLTGVKAATRLAGVDMGPARRPLPPVPAQAREAIRQALSRLSDGPISTERLAWCNRLDTRDDARFDAR